MSNSKGNRVLFLFSVKALLSSLLSIFSLSTIFSFIILKIDASDKIYGYFSVLIIFISTFVTAYIATYGLKNNILPFAIIGISPIIILSIVNCCFNGEILLFVIKIIVSCISCILIALIQNKKKGRIRI